MAGIWHCYCDESCIGKPHKFMAVGGLLVRWNDSDQIRSEILKWRADRGMRREMKWSAVDAVSYDRYCQFIAARFGNIISCQLAFCALTIDRKQLNHRAYNDGSEDVGISKFYYQMILHRFVPLMGVGSTLYIFPDKKNEKFDYNELQSSLNRRVKVAKVQPICSKKTNFGQLNDILLGAVAFRWNDKHLDPDVTEPKIKLAEYIASLVGLPSLATETPPYPTQFGIWNFRLQPRIPPLPNKEGAPTPSRNSGPHLGGSQADGRRIRKS